MDITLFVVGNFFEELKSWLWFLSIGMLSGVFILITNKEDNDGEK